MDSPHIAKQTSMARAPSLNKCGFATYTSEPFISTFWPSEQVKLRGHSYPAGTAVNNLTDHTQFLQIPAQTNTVTATATTTFESSPNATNPVSNASAPSTTTSGTTNSDPYPPSGTLALNDPLRDNSRGYGWQTSPPASSNGGFSCQFTGGAYYAYSQDNIYNTCRPSLNASNLPLKSKCRLSAEIAVGSHCVMTKEVTPIPIRFVRMGPIHLIASPVVYKH